MSVCCECCVLSVVSASGWSLVQKNPTEWDVSIWVWSWILDNEEALAHWGLLCHGKIELYMLSTNITSGIYMRLHEIILSKQRMRSSLITNFDVLNFLKLFYTLILDYSQSQWPRGLRRRSAAARLLRSWVRIPPRAWMFVCCECCVFSGRGLCDRLVTRPEESYRLWCVVVCDLGTLWMRRPCPTGGCRAKKNTCW